MWGCHPSPHGSVQTVMPVPMTSSPRSPLIHPGWFLLVDSRIDVLSETISKWVLAKMGGRTRSDTSDPLMETGNRVVWASRVMPAGLLTLPS